MRPDRAAGDGPESDPNGVLSERSKGRPGRRFRPILQEGESKESNPLLSGTAEDASRV
jgi:hypothetical protein